MLQVLEVHWLKFTALQCYVDLIFGLEVIFLLWGATQSAIYDRSVVSPLMWCFVIDRQYRRSHVSIQTITCLWWYLLYSCFQLCIYFGIYCVGQRLCCVIFWYIYVVCCTVASLLVDPVLYVTNAQGTFDFESRYIMSVLRWQVDQTLSQSEWLHWNKVWIFNWNISCGFLFKHVNNTESSD